MLTESLELVWPCCLGGKVQVEKSQSAEVTSVLESHRYWPYQHLFLAFICIELISTQVFPGSLSALLQPTSEGSLRLHFLNSPGPEFLLFEGFCLRSNTDSFLQLLPFFQVVSDALGHNNVNHSCELKTNALICDFLQHLIDPQGWLFLNWSPTLSFALIKHMLWHLIG